MPRTIDYSGELLGLAEELGTGYDEHALLEAIDRGSSERELTYDELQEVIRLRINLSLEGET